MPTLRALGLEGIAAYDELDALGELDAAYRHNGILSLYLAEEVVPVGGHGQRAR